MNRSALFRDFCAFASGQLRSGDIDPMYPVLRLFYANERLDREIALWRTLLYLTWYHVGSAETVWKRFPEPRALPAQTTRNLPTGIERRGFRGNDRARDFVNAVLARATKHGSLVAWFAFSVQGERTTGWDRARGELSQVSFAGPWATYKWADLLKNVHGAPIEATSIGDKLGETAGPIPGMVKLTGLSWKTCASDISAQRRLLDACLKAGVPFSGLDQLETSLCDFNSLLKGGYYLGHDIDHQMTQLEKSCAGLWEARSVFPDSFRGELAGWTGVRKNLLKTYASAGKLVNA